MKILALETSTDSCSAALLLADRQLSASRVESRSHTRLLLPMIDDLLKQGSTTLAALSCLAFGSGPGSFTGLRIACSTIQGLSMGNDKPILAISSLRTLAQGIYRVSHHPRVFAYLDARHGQIYGGHYAIDTACLMQRVHADAVYPVEALRGFAKDWTVATGYPEAQDLLSLAFEGYHTGKALRAADLSPVYLGSLFQQ
jgi:tRNA threonylcarbamoyladenosine biosynthesis protein TsaB